MRLAAATWTEVETYLKTKNTLILPIGSTEQHGPTGPIGTDSLCADAVARAAGELTGVLVAPPLPYGMSSHHMAFPGSATLRPSVYQAVLADLLRGFCDQGFRKFFVVNGHGGNEASVALAFQELKHENREGVAFHLINWWKLPEVAELASELYGNEEGSHAACSEVSLAFHCEGITRREYKAPGKGHGKGPWPLTAREFRATFADGTIGSNPGLSRGEHGQAFLKVAAQAVGQIINGC